MKNKPSFLTTFSFACSLFLLIGLLSNCTSHAQPTASTSGEFQISPPVISQNLQVFLIHGKEQISGKTYLTLGEAMEQKKVKVNETGSVNQLSIDNDSDDYVFIHSGDIVKGGKQDRTLSYDVIIPPHSKNVPLASFCVEQGRWRKRGGESLQAFNSNTKMLSSKELRLSAKYDKNQQKVWGNVADQKQELSQNISQHNGYSVNVADSNSQSSLQLALENKELVAMKSKREGVFKNLLTENPTAIGYAYAINGEVYGVDIYNNRKLFEDMWPKLLESILVESLSVSQGSEGDGQAVTFASVANVTQFMEGISLSKAENKKEKVNEATVFRTEENKDNYLLFSTEDEKSGKWVHRNYMKRDSSNVKKNPVIYQEQNRINIPIQQNRINLPVEQIRN